MFLTVQELDLLERLGPFLLLKVQSLDRLEHLGYTGGKGVILRLLAEGWVSDDGEGKGEAEGGA